MAGGYELTTSISSAAPSGLAGNMSQLFGDVSAGGGLKFPKWAVPLGIVLFFTAAIVAVIVLGRRK